MNPKLDDATMHQLESRFTEGGDWTPLPLPIPDGEIAIGRLLRAAGLAMERLPDQGKALEEKTLLLYKRARGRNKSATIYQACQIVAELVNTQLPARPVSKAARKALRRKQARVPHG